MVGKVGKVGMFIYLPWECQIRGVEEKREVKRGAGGGMEGKKRKGEISESVT